MTGLHRMGGDIVNQCMYIHTYCTYTHACNNTNCISTQGHTCIQVHTVRPQRRQVCKSSDFISLNYTHRNPTRPLSKVWLDDRETSEHLQVAMHKGLLSDLLL